MPVTIIRDNGDSLTFDGWEDGSRSGKATLTEHPIEDGSSVVDHSQRENTMLSLTVKQSEFPINQTDSNTYGEARVLEALNFLEEIGSTGEPVTIEIPRLGVYEGYVLQSWPTNILPTREGSFSLKFRQIVIAGVEIVEVVPVDAVAPGSRAGQQPSEDVGDQPTEEQEDDGPPSILSSIF